MGFIEPTLQITPEQIRELWERNPARKPLED
jgi:hypothetical protein